MRCKGLFGVFILIVGNIILYHGASLYTVDELHTRTSSDPRTSGSYYGRINETKIRSTSAYDHSQKVHRVWPKLPDGRLGNHLFNLACAYGLARINNRQLILEPQYQKHLMHFLNVSHFPFEIANIPDGTARKNFRYAVYEPQKVHLEEKDYVIGNYIQTRQYFQPYESEILDIFTIRDDLIAASQIFLRGLHFPPNSTLVGIHVRRGDVATKLAEEHGRRQPKPIYVENAMAYFLRKYHNVHFIVCSDDIDWSKEQIVPHKLSSTAEYSVHFSSKTSSPQQDLTLLSQCNHTIITVGTFGWWGAWLAGGEVIYFNHPIEPGGDRPVSKDFNAEDYFWPTWIGMDDSSYGTEER